MSADEPVVVDPLTGELSPVRVHSTKNGWTDTNGKIVVPGLAITRSADSSVRYSITHLGSGLDAVSRRCGQHILDAAELAAESGIDWTVTGKEEIATAVTASTFVADLRGRIGWLCADHCAGDGPKPPQWEVSCSTCGWVSEDDDGLFTAADAKRVADDHDCEPEMSIKDPATGRWHAVWLVNDDGTVRDASPRRPETVAAPDRRAGG
jgi:hypothetical protein